MMQTDNSTDKLWRLYKRSPEPDDFPTKKLGALCSFTPAQQVMPVYRCFTANGTWFIVNYKGMAVPIKVPATQPMILLSEFVWSTKPEGPMDRLTGTYKYNILLSGKGPVIAEVNCVYVVTPTKQRMRRCAGR